MDLPRFETLALELADHVALVELNRPEKANAMSAAMWRELEECFRWCDREPAVRAVVLAARGRHFCAGIDLQMFATLDDPSLEPGRRAEHRRHHIERLQANAEALYLEELRRSAGGAVRAMLGLARVRHEAECQLELVRQESHVTVTARTPK